MLLKKGLGLRNKEMTEDEGCGDWDRRLKNFEGDTGRCGNLGFLGVGGEETSELS